MRVFLAGIMQGSIVQNHVHEQTYREALAELLLSHVPGVEVFDPWVVYPDSPSYEDDRVRAVLLANLAQAAQSDLVIAYLPEASMGTALEMWEAWRAGVPVIAITPLAANWVVRVVASQRFETLDEFARAVRSGLVALLISD
jgi:nucleoside 2-deoxyribosyltransferase